MAMISKLIFSQLYHIDEFIFFLQKKEEETNLPLLPYLNTIFNNYFVITKYNKLKREKPIPHTLCPV